MTEKISGGAFKQMVAFGAACITAQKQAINDLNVFPVPDGDTGTNMSLTIQTAVNELRKAEPATVDEAAKLTASGLLRGARGNSGVILSLLFRGMSKVLKGHDTADGALLAEAMQEGVSTAYGAVMKPAEGTVLTVSRLAAQRALEAAGEKNDAEFVLDEAIKTGYTTLAETIEMNPVLKKAGVVDAGGKGYLIILEGMLRACGASPYPRWSILPRRRRTSPPSATRTSPLPLTPCSSSAKRRISPWTVCGPTWAASATAWSSARMTRPSRSTSTPTPPATP